MRRDNTGARVGDLVRRHRPDYQITLFMGILLLLGLIVLFSISPARVELINQEGYSLDQAHFMQKQVVYLLIGLSAFLVAAWMPVRFWTSIAGKVLMAGFAASALLFLLGLFDSSLVLKSGGATRWFNVGFGTFQPAELLKFGIMLFTALFLGRRIKQGKVNDVHETLIPLAVLLGISMFFIIILQKDMGTGITLTGIVASMLYLAGISRKYMTVGIVGLALIGVLLIITSPHRIERVQTFFNPGGAGEAEGYHIEQAAIALGSGGFTGRGLGQSVQAFGYLPEALNDSIFAIFGESFGFVGSVVVMSIFFALLLRLLKIHDHIVDPVQRMLVAGVFGWVASHTVVNIGAMIGVFPLTGVTLPFLSFGGTSLLFIMTALGIAFHISRYTSHSQITQPNNGGSSNEDSRGRRGIGRTRYASTRSY